MVEQKIRDKLEYVTGKKKKQVVPTTVNIQQQQQDSQVTSPDIERPGPSSVAGDNHKTEQGRCNEGFNAEPIAFAF